MSARRVLLGALVLAVGLVAQSAVLSRIPLPGGAPDLLLVLVVAFALAEGQRSGAVTGFVTGLLADLGADHELGRTALVYALVGYVAGLARTEARPSLLVPLVVVGAAAAAGVTVFAVEGLLLADPRITAATYRQSIIGTVPYCLILTLLVVPAVGILVRRLDLDPLRR